MSKACLITELNTKELVSAIMAFKAFCTQIQLNQAQMTPIIIMPSSIMAYTLSAWNNSQSCPPKDGGLVTTKENVNATTPPPAQHHGDKHDPITPESSSDNNLSRRQKAKKAKKGSKVDDPTKDRKEMGMFFLKNPNINASDVFPKDLSLKLCASFTCKGKECSNMSCGFKHPTKAGKIPCESILASAAHFVVKDVGWFNEYHFMKVPDEQVKKLLSNVKGISSETA